ncbi:MAG: redoxin domain-containing protein [Candidatus Eisenbacteria bacterium]|uniref:Redoxin domain-containing protein n=1 Tax=Eiseniibacteriota bacterium TaxID=2212470 RepID=A0A538TJQ7_UNCEI|nr:MAG: redoxin domain-containing protein [Candidatus Eisenbacteria bacterium]
MNANPRAPELPSSFAWLNTDRPLMFAKELKGQVVLLDFWTYCCINCMHVLPDLAYLEEKYKDQPFLVIGVHSAKFTNEGQRQTVRAAVGRYEIAHPVIIDEEMALWGEYAVRSWPTLVLVGPDRKIVGAVAGEGNREGLDEAIAQVLAEGRAAGTLASAPLKFEREQSVRAASGLAFPGKILADPKGKRLFIADSNHNRVVVATLPDSAGRSSLIRVIGSGREGRDDAPADRATFHHPQGLALMGSTLLVADTENHMIRAVDLDAWTVRAVAGTGVQGYDRAGGKVGTKQVLNSPWDLAVEGSTCYIAMAGPHQIWRLDLPMGLCRAFAGSGRENIVDGPVEAAALAQPSGVALAGNYLYFADSEVSAVRRIDLAEELVETLVGKGLFDYGDIDGPLADARLQHPLGVTISGEKILVADTYNHKIKELDPKAGTIRTLAGTGKPGAQSDAALALFEPGGLHAAEGVLYIADTNNHRVVRVSLADLSWSEITIEGLEAPGVSRREETEHATATLTAPAKLRAGAATEWKVRVRLPEGTHVSEEAPASVRVSRGGSVLMQRTMLGATWPLAFELPAQPSGSADLHVQVSFAYCHEGMGVCVPANPSWSVPVSFSERGESATELTAAVA